MLLNSANNMANRAFHMSIRGCSATANNYGVRRCSTRHDVFLSAVGWSEYHLVMIKSSSRAYSSTTVSVSPITSQLHPSRFYRQSHLLLERRRHSTEFVTRKRLFSSTPSDTNDKDDGVVGGSDAKIDRSNFTKEVKIEMPKLDDNIKGERVLLRSDVIINY